MPKNLPDTSPQSHPPPQNQAKLADMTRVTIPNDKHAVMYVFEELAPKLGPAANQFADAVYAQTTLPLREFEAARFRIAQINNCQLCLDWRTERADEATPPQSLYDAVQNWQTSAELSDRERLAAEYAERFAQEHLELDDDFWQRMHAAYSDSEIAELSLCLALWLGLGRVNNVLGIDVACTL